MLKQKYRIINGIKKAICPLCNNSVKYLDSVYYRGVELHRQCVLVARQKKFLINK